MCVCISQVNVRFPLRPLPARHAAPLHRRPLVHFARATHLTGSFNPGTVHVYMCVCVCVCVYVYTYKERETDGDIHILQDIFVCLCVCVYVCI